MVCGLVGGCLGGSVCTWFGAVVSVRGGYKFSILLLSLSLFLVLSATSYKGSAWVAAFVFVTVIFSTMYVLLFLVVR